MNMNKKKKVPIVFKKERVVLSDILPFEIPITFSNRHFYQFLVKNQIHFDGNGYVWKTDDPVIAEIMLLITGLDRNNKQQGNLITDKRNKPRIPFQFNVSHKETDFRLLTVTHPKNQIQMVHFYDVYKDLIIYFNNISSFSLRRPTKVAKFTYWKDKTHFDNVAENPEYDSVEGHDREYEHLRTYFGYREYSNIHKFFESYKYHRCEKKYNRLFKVDISKCFDSIYTHSISWAVYNKEIIKENLTGSKSTFPGQFDALMQCINYGETNGIVIGPEFSRIFAEIILQQVDKNVIEILKSKTLFFKKDYEIYRYVDDFFIFYNNEQCLEILLKVLKLELTKYNFFLNEGKSKLYEKPLITEITIAKQKISDLLNKYLIFKVTEVLKEDDEQKEVIEKKYSIYISSNKLITKFKTIVKETGVQYKDILNYTLASIDRKTLKLIKDFFQSDNKTEKQQNFTTAIFEILDFVFFIYSVAPRVNTTIKLCMILSKITKFYKVNASISYNSKHLIFKKISDDISLILKKNSRSEYVPVETLYLLTALRELGREYRLDSRVLCEYFDINPDSFELKNELDHFGVTTLLFYIGNKIRYSEINKAVCQHIFERFQRVGKEDFKKHAELIFLLLDMLTCPYVTDDFKKQLLIFAGVDESSQVSIINHRKYWFTKWSNFKFAKELEAKKSIEVY